MAKKALISTVEPRQSGYRVAQVEDAANIFEVAPSLYWVDCPDEISGSDSFWYNPSDGSFNPNPNATPTLPTTPTKDELLAQLLELQAKINSL